MKQPKEKLLKIINEECAEIDATPVYATYTGSILHGTESENSDTDVTVIYVPSKNSLLLGKMKEGFKTQTEKNKNSGKDIDIEYISIHRFLQRLAKGNYATWEVFMSQHNPEMHILHNIKAMESIFYVGMRLMMTSKNISSMIKASTSIANNADIMFDSIQMLETLKISDFIRTLSRSKDIYVDKTNISAIRKELEEFLKEEGLFLSRFEESINGDVFLGWRENSSLRKLTFRFDGARALEMYPRDKEREANSTQIKAALTSLRIMNDFSLIFKNINGDLKCDKIYPISSSKSIVEIKNKKEIKVYELQKMLDSKALEIHEMMKKEKENWHKLKDKPSPVVDTSILEVVYEVERQNK